MIYVLQDETRRRRRNQQRFLGDHGWPGQAGP
jgi:hypothetical protein